jgi:uncharacterized protein
MFAPRALAQMCDTLVVIDPTRLRPLDLLLGFSLRQPHRVRVSSEPAHGERLNFTMRSNGRGGLARRRRGDTLATAVPRAPLAQPGLCVYPQQPHVDLLVYVQHALSAACSRETSTESRSVMAGTDRAHTVEVPDTDLRVRLQPRAKRNAIVEERAGVLRVSVAAAPVDGQANAALCKLIAKRAGVARGRVSIVRGERSREKTVRVEGITEGELRRALGLERQ